MPTTERGERPRPTPMSGELLRKLEGLVPWTDLGPTAPAREDAGGLASPLAEDAGGVVHLGSYNHERWSVQRELLAVTDREVSVAEAIAQGLVGRRVVCWHPQFWRLIPEDRRRGSRAICLFHHHVEGFDAPGVVAALCLNASMRDELARRQPGKVVRLVRAGGAEDAIAHARPRRDDGGKIRLVLCGNARAPIASDADDGRMASRKGAELIGPIAERLDPRTHAWLFLGVGWEPYAEQLAARGWSVTCPGPLEPPGHYEFFGEGDIFLMLSRLEGLPLPLLEAMGAGLWPICTATGLAPELLGDGHNGHLLPPYHGRNAGAVADAAARAIRSLDAAHLAGARERVRQSVAHHTWANFRRDVQDTIREVFGAD